MFLPLDVFGKLHYSNQIARDQFQISYLSLLRTSEQLIAQVKRAIITNCCEPAARRTRRKRRATFSGGAPQEHGRQIPGGNGAQVRPDHRSGRPCQSHPDSYRRAEPGRTYPRPISTGALGISPNSPTQVVKAPIPVETTDGRYPRSLTKTAKAQRPEVKIQQASISASKSNILLQRTGAKPSVGLSGAYNYVSAQSFSTSNISYNALATLTIPIWDGGVTKARVDQAVRRSVLGDGYAGAGRVGNQPGSQHRRAGARRSREAHEDHHGERHSGRGSSAARQRSLRGRDSRLSRSPTPNLRVDPGAVQPSQRPV